MIPAEQWQWYGWAGHLIVGHDCRFHLCTVIGDYIVSTVGAYLPDSNVRDTMASVEGIQLDGRGDARRADWMRKKGYVEIGYQRLYETMVFKTNGRVCEAPSCNCGLPEHDGRELDFQGYNTAAEATAGHIAVCQRVAAGALNT